MKKTSVAVIPRERFSLLPLSLRSLFETIEKDVPVIVVICGMVDYIKKELDDLREERPFELVECDEFILPNKARNIALERIGSKYVAFCDNDLEYRQGWLDALVENAEANNSAAVAPLTLMGPSEPPIIHHAGGSLWLRTDTNGRRLFIDRHRYDHALLPEAESDQFAKAPLDHMYFEYHCVLIKVEAMRAAGPHDERLIMHEHTENSLRLMMAGGRLTFEPNARVMYRVFERFDDKDWPYFLFRWALHRGETSDRIFEENWGVYKDSIKWIRNHHRRAMFTRLPPLPKYFRRGKIKLALLKFYEPRILSKDTKQPDEEMPRVPPRPPADGLEKAGVRVFA